MRPATKAIARARTTRSSTRWREPTCARPSAPSARAARCSRASRRKARLRSSARCTAWSAGGSISSPDRRSVDLDDPRLALAGLRLRGQPGRRIEGAVGVVAANALDDLEEEAVFERFGIDVEIVSVGRAIEQDPELAQRSQQRRG